MEAEEAFSPSLEELLSAASLKWIFVGGKGGVGKTTTACSIAIQLAKDRENVLILSTDPAHNLSDTFGQKFTNTPTLIEGFTNLYALEIDSHQNDGGEYTLPTKDGLAKYLPDLLQAFPGIDETLSLAEIMQSVQNLNFTTIVFDTAPTGHTLRLLELPELLKKGLKLMSSVYDKYSNALNMVSSVTGLKMNEEELSSTVNNLKVLSAFVRETFRDPTKTTFVCVCIPEFLSVYETERLIQELAKRGIDCSNIVVNQVLFKIEDVAIDDFPSEITKKALKLSEEHLSKENEALKQRIRYLEKRVYSLEQTYMGRRQMQSKYLSQIHDLYGYDFHVVSVPQLTSEVRGIELLEKFGKLLLDEKPLPIVTESELSSFATVA